MARDGANSGTLSGDAVAVRPPRPPQVTWIRRGGVVAVSVVMGVAVLRIGWGLAARHRLDAQIERYKAAGQPVYASEFNDRLDAVPAERNAAVPLEKAMEALVVTTQSGVSYQSFLDDPTKFETDTAAARELVQANTEVFRLLREARHRPEVAWRSRIGQFNTSVRLGSQQRVLAKFLWLAAKCHFRAGDHEEAVRVLRDFVAFNDAIDAEPTVTTSLTAWACHDLAFEVLQEELHGLQVDSAPTMLAVRPAPREAMETLVSELLAEEAMRHNVVRSFYGSRAFALHDLETASLANLMVLQKVVGTPRGSPWREIIDVMGHPAVVLDYARSIRYDTIAARAAADPTWPAASRHFPDEKPTGDILTRLTRPSTYTPYGPAVPSRFAYFFFRTLAKRRMAVVAVAIRLYEVDHGHRPGRISALVPAYLPALPPDPFAADGASFGYRPEAARALLYSIGADGEDRAGETVREPDGSRDRERSDIPFYLEPGSSGEADDHDQDVQDEQGKEDQNDESQRQPDQR